MTTVGTPIRLLLADDQALVRGALAALLALEPDLEVVAEVGRGDEVVAEARRARPDVALLDVEMPGLDGITATGQLRAALPSCRVLMVTTFGRPGYLRRAMAAGASGFLNWHWIFFVNLPIGILTAVLALRVVPRDRGTGLRQGADVLGALLITGAMMLSVFTIVKPAAEDGWLAGRTLTFGAVALALLAGFIVRQLTARHPLMPLRILAARKIAAANLIQVLSVAGMFGVFFLGALYLRRILGYSPLEIGLAFLPVAVVMGALSVRYTDRLAGRFGARAVLIAGLVLIAGSLVLFAQAPIHGGYAIHDLPVMVLMGAGAGLAFPALMTVAMAGATPADAGLASGLVNTTAQVGGALGLAVLATVSAGRTGTLAARGEGAMAALNDGYHLAFWIAASLVAVAIAVAATVLRSSD